MLKSTETENYINSYLKDNFEQAIDSLLSHAVGKRLRELKSNQFSVTHMDFFIKNNEETLVKAMKDITVIKELVRKQAASFAVTNKETI